MNIENPITINIDLLTMRGDVRSRTTIHYASSTTCAEAFDRIANAAQPIPRRGRGNGPRTRRVPAKLAAAKQEDPQ